MPAETRYDPKAGATAFGRYLVAVFAFVVLKDLVLLGVPRARHGAAAAALAFVVTWPATYVMIRRSEQPPRLLALGASLVLAAAMAGFAFLIQTR